MDVSVVEGLQRRIPTGFRPADYVVPHWRCTSFWFPQSTTLASFRLIEHLDEDRNWKVPVDSERDVSNPMDATQHHHPPPPHCRRMEVIDWILFIYLFIYV